MARRPAKRDLTTGILVVLLAGVLVSQALQAGATHEPADKVSAAGSTVAVFSPDSAVVLLSETVRTSKPTDLILGVTLECSITTDVVTVGSDSQSAEGTVRVWVRIDNSPYAAGVPVSQDDTGGGRVVFCNRLYLRQTSLGGDDQNDAIRTFMATRAANAFNWMALDVGSGIHTIEVLAELTTSASQRAAALAAVGNRTLMVEPVKATNDEKVTALG